MGVVAQNLVPFGSPVYTIRRGRVRAPTPRHLRSLAGERCTRASLLSLRWSHRPERDDWRKAGHRVPGDPERHWTAQRQRVRVEPTGECGGAGRTAWRVSAGRSRMALLTPSLRKFALAVHVTSSVGWLGGRSW